MNRTLLDECFRVAGRTTWYQQVAEIQRDLDHFLEFYNLQRSHQGYRLSGRTPAQAPGEALDRPELPPFTQLFWRRPNKHPRPPKAATRKTGCRAMSELVHAWDLLLAGNLDQEIVDMGSVDIGVDEMLSCLALCFVGVIKGNLLEPRYCKTALKS
jgi:hypothetical protein